MVFTPVAELVFVDDADEAGCFGCAERVITLPGPLPDTGDDFDWRVRDYDSFRQFMLEELASLFPERRRWTAADLEVVIVEVLAASLDQLSDMADRVFAEGYLETARRPDSVRRLLSLIGFDAVANADAQNFIDINVGTDDALANDMLEQFWAQNPHAMEDARKAGPGSIRTQHRMVSLQDYAERLEDHPLVTRAKASARWTGSWSTIFVAIIPWDTDATLDTQVEPDPFPALGTAERKRWDRLQNSVTSFNEERRLAVPLWDSVHKLTLRTILRPFIDAYRMAGQEVILQDAIPVGITIIVTLNVKRNYFASEVSREAARRLGNGPEGFFMSGRLRFGEDLYASDIIAVLMQIDGVDNVCLTRFKRSGAAFPNQSASGRIRLNGLELAVCDNDRTQMNRGYLTIHTNGGNGA